MNRGDILMAYTLHGRWGFNSDYSFEENTSKKKGETRKSQKSRERKPKSWRVGKKHKLSIYEKEFIESVSHFCSCYYDDFMLHIYCHRW
jgi:hypothetical protein